MNRLSARWSVRVSAIVATCAAPVVGSGQEFLEREIGAGGRQAASLEVLCEEIGARMTGTAALDRAVDWAVDEFEGLALRRVRKEPYRVPVAWAPGESRLEVLKPKAFDVAVKSSGWVPATAPGGLEAEVVDGGIGRVGVIRRRSDEIRGKIVLVRADVARSFTDLGIDQRRATIALREAHEAGARAVLFVSNRPDGALYRNINSFTGRLDALPSAVIGRAGGERLLGLLESGASPRVRLELPNVIREDAVGYNVAGEIRGTSRRKEVVLLGAHLDSWDIGSGCADNAANVALVMEVARVLRAHARAPKRTIRFVLFTGEEQGLLGSRAYVEKQRRRLDRISAVLVHDMGFGAIKGYSLGGRPELDAPLSEALAGLPERFRLRHTREAFFGSDHFDFWLEGIPAFVAIQDTREYYKTYHSETDVLERVDLGQVREQTLIAATAVWGLATRDELLGGRLNRDEVGALLKRTKVDEQLDFIGLLDQWKRGERGRR